MTISRDLVLPRFVQVAVAGAAKGTVRIDVQTEYIDDVALRTDSFNVIREFTPTDDITELPQVAQDFITAVRTHFGV